MLVLFFLQSIAEGNCEYIMHSFCQKHWYSVSNYIIFFLQDLDSSGHVGKNGRLWRKNKLPFLPRGFFKFFGKLAHSAVAAAAALRQNARRRRAVAGAGL